MKAYMALFYGNYLAFKNFMKYGKYIFPWVWILSIPAVRRYFVNNKSVDPLKVADSVTGDPSWGFASNYAFGFMCMILVAIFSTLLYLIKLFFGIVHYDKVFVYITILGFPIIINFFILAWNDRNLKYFIEFEKWKDSKKVFVSIFSILVFVFCFLVAVYTGYHCVYT